MSKERIFLKIFAAALIFISTSSTYGQDRPAFDFLKIDPSARASALAGAFETYTDDPNIIFYNPAGISTITRKHVSAAFGKYLLDINFGAASFGMNYGDLGWFGLGVKYVNYGTFDYTDENGATSGTFDANDVMVALGYSNYLYDEVNYGVNAKFVYSNIAQYRSSAVAFDLGLMYLIPAEQISVGISLNNFGSQLSPYIDTKEKLPLDLRVGASKKLEHLPLRISFSLTNINEKRNKLIQYLKPFSIGGELTFSENVQARIGYSNEKRQDLKLGTSLGIAGFSAGIGIRILDRYSFDYSLNSLGKVGSTHRFNLGFSFD
jgi:hypothetical protein